MDECMHHDQSSNAQWAHSTHYTLQGLCMYICTYIYTYVWTISPLCQLAVVLCVIVNQCACTHACTLAFLLSGLSLSSSSLSCLSSSDERNADRQTDRQSDRPHWLPLHTFMLSRADQPPCPSFSSFLCHLCPCPQPRGARFHQVKRCIY